MLQEISSMCEKLVVITGSFPTLSPETPTCLQQAVTLTLPEHLNLIKAVLPSTEEDDPQPSQSLLAADRLVCLHLFFLWEQLFNTSFNFQIVKQINYRNALKSPFV